MPLKKVLVPTVLPTKSLLDWILGASRAAVMVAAVTEVCRAAGARARTLLGLLASTQTG